MRFFASLCCALNDNSFCFLECLVGLIKDSGNSLVIFFSPEKQLFEFYD